MPDLIRLRARRERSDRHSVENEALFVGSWWAASIAFGVVTWLLLITLLF